jgi:hypothetical protein
VANSTGAGSGVGTPAASTTPSWTTGSAGSTAGGGSADSTTGPTGSLDGAGVASPGLWTALTAAPAVTTPTIVRAAAAACVSFVMRRLLATSRLNRTAEAETPTPQPAGPPSAARTVADASAGGTITPLAWLASNADDTPAAGARPRRVSRPRN